MRVCNCCNCLLFMLTIGCTCVHVFLYVIICCYLPDGLVPFGLFGACLPCVLHYAYLAVYHRTHTQTHTPKQRPHHSDHHVTITPQHTPHVTAHQSRSHAITIPAHIHTDTHKPHLTRRHTHTRYSTAMTRPLRYGAALLCMVCVFLCCTEVARAARYQRVLLSGIICMYDDVWWRMCSLIALF